jgi:hypothetical protein
MATKYPSDRKVINKGKTVAFFTGKAEQAEAFILKLRAATGARVEWGYCGGVGSIVHLGNKLSRENVRQVIRNLAHESGFEFLGLGEMMNDLEILLQFGKPPEEE